MKVLVTGGTGFVGQEIVQQLLGVGHDVRVLARHPSRVSLPATNVEVVRGDVTIRESLDNALAGIEAVLHLVGIISEVGASTFENIHVGGTQRLVQAIRTRGIKRIVHISALGTRPNAVSRYHRTKWEAEELVRKSGLAWTIFRPSLIYGPRDQFVNLFATIARFSPVVPILGRKDSKFAPVSVRQVGRAFARSLSEEQAAGKTFDLCGADALTLSQIVNAILEVTRRRRFKLHIPNWLAMSQARFLEFLYPTILRKAPPLNRDQLVMLNEDNLGNGQPADELFGLQHRTFREAIAEYLR